MLAMVKCNVQKMKCMVHQCHKYPIYTALREYLESKFQKYAIEEDITYSMWDSNNRNTLRTHNSSWWIHWIACLPHRKLSKHSFIAKSQVWYLKVQKEEKDEETCIILLDFAEHYHLIVQDEVLGYHWKKDQCTFHLVMTYYKNQENQLVNTSICILSDDLDHDTSFAHDSRNWYAISFKKHYLQSSILSIWAMVVQVNTRISKTLWICTIIWMTFGLMLSGHSFTLYSQNSTIFKQWLSIKAFLKIFL